MSFAHCLLLPSISHLCLMSNTCNIMTGLPLSAHVTNMFYCVCVLVYSPNEGFHGCWLKNDNLLKCHYITDITTFSCKFRNANGDQTKDKHIILSSDHIFCRTPNARPSSRWSEFAGKFSVRSMSLSLGHLCYTAVLLSAWCHLLISLFSLSITLAHYRRVHQVTWNNVSITEETSCPVLWSYVLHCS